MSRLILMLELGAVSLAESPPGAGMFPDVPPHNLCFWPMGPFSPGMAEFP